MVLIRVLMIALVFQTVVFASLWFYARARRRERLEADWLKSDQTKSLEGYLQEGADVYHAALLLKLVIGVYLVPSAALAVFIYVTSSG